MANGSLKTESRHDADLVVIDDTGSPHNDNEPKVPGQWWHSFDEIIAK